MRFFYTIATLLISLFAMANEGEGGIQVKRKLFVVSIGFAGNANHAGSNYVIDTAGGDFFFSSYFPTCKADAKTLSDHFKNKRGSATFDDRIDSIYTYTFHSGELTLDSIYTLFERLRQKIGVNDYFIFYYASGVWGKKKGGGDLPEESYYGLNERVAKSRDFNQDAFTLRHLKILTDRLLTENQLIIFDTGEGASIQADFYRSFFSDNILEAGFSKKNRIILCPEMYSGESRDEKDQTFKGDLVSVLTSLPDSLNMLSFFDEASELSYRSTYKQFMGIFWEYQINKLAQIRVLREKDYLQLLGYIKPSYGGGKRGLKKNVNEQDIPVDTMASQRIKKALVIATNEYQSDQWSRLKNPLSDGDSVAALLLSKYGYLVEKKYNATREEILQAVDDLAGESSSNPYNQYVIYIAGHGFFDPRQQAGYLVCRDSKSIQNVSRPGTLELGTYIDYTTLYRRLGADLNRIVLIVDVCFGGASYNNFPGSQDLVDPSQEKNKKKQPYKKVLASGVTEVDDFVRTGSGAITRNSPFASEILRALRAGKKDTLDFDSMYGSLINAEPKLKPKPVQFSFGKTALSGEFIF